MTPDMNAVMAAVMDGSRTTETIAAVSGLAPIATLRAAARLRKLGLVDRVPVEGRLLLLPKFRRD